MVAVSDEHNLFGRWIGRKHREILAKVGYRTTSSVYMMDFGHNVIVFGAEDCRPLNNASWWRDA